MRRYLLVLLGLLQLVAPLVHAHSGNDFAQFGLHLPSLEVYSAAYQKTLPFSQAVDLLAESDNVIVSISTGIKNADNLDHHTPTLHFPPTPFSFNITLVPLCCNFSPQLPTVITHFARLPQTPRAPPISFLF